MTNILDSILSSRRALSVEGPALAGLASGGIGKLVPMRLAGVESINELYEYRLTLQTPDALGLSVDMESNYDLSAWIGKELTCKIELEGRGSFVAGMAGKSGAPNIGAGVREISGLVTEARFIGVESRHALYEVTIRPWLYLATLNSECKVFQNLTPIEVVEQVLSGYAFPLQKRLIEEYPKRDYSPQFNESDFDFVSRLLQEFGVSYHFEHSGGAHRLVLSDNNAAFEQNASTAYHDIRYYPPGHKVDEEYIHALTPKERITSGVYKSREYDYTRPKANLEQSESDPRNTGHSQQEVYRWRTASNGSDYSQPNAGSEKQANQTEAQGRILARVRMQALRQGGNRARGEGHIRGIAAGSTFHLHEHPKKSGNTEYLVLTAYFEIENVSEDTLRNAGQTTVALTGVVSNGTIANTKDLFMTVTKALTDTQRQLGIWQVKTTLEVQPTQEALRPEQTIAKPRINSTEVAIVTCDDCD